jgi:hypothetical protein
MKNFMNALCARYAGERIVDVNFLINLEQVDNQDMCELDKKLAKAINGAKLQDATRLVVRVCA